MAAPCRLGRLICRCSRQASLGQCGTGMQSSRDLNISTPLLWGPPFLCIQKEIQILVASLIPLKRYRRDCDMKTIVIYWTAGDQCWTERCSPLSDCSDCNTDNLTREMVAWWIIYCSDSTAFDYCITEFYMLRHQLHKCGGTKICLDWQNSASVTAFRLQHN